MVARLAEAWAAGDDRLRVPALLLAAGVIAAPMGVASARLSRTVEARADADALRLTGAAAPFVAFHRRIALRNVVDPDPPAWLSALLGTHPTTMQRIGIAERFAASSGAPAEPATAADSG